MGTTSVISRILIPPINRLVVMEEVVTLLVHGPGAPVMPNTCRNPAGNWLPAALLGPKQNYFQSGRQPTGADWYGRHYPDVVAK